MQCPVGSNSTGGTVSECACNDGLATATGLTTTTNDPCVECRADYYSSCGECVPCPAMSGRAFSDIETACTCNEGYITYSIIPASDPCNRCIADYYRSDDGECVPCPATSGRAFSDIETACTCNQGYRLPNGSVDTTTEDCVGECM